MNIEDIKNEYEGKRILLLGNGPGLEVIPQHLLENEYIFAMNRFDIANPFPEVTPDFYISVKSYERLQWKAPWLESLNKFVQNPECIVFMSKSAGNQIRYNQESNMILNYNTAENNFPWRSFSPHQLNDLHISRFSEIWSEDITEVVYVLHTMYVAYQIIRYMGFSEIYLAGVNLYPNYINFLKYPSGLNPADYAHSKVEFVKSAISNKNLMKSLLNAVWLKSLNIINEYNIDHRIGKPMYAAKNYKNFHTNPQLNDELIKSHIIAKKMLAKDNISVYNVTPNSRLDVFPKVPQSTLFMHGQT